MKRSFATVVAVLVLLVAFAAPAQAKQANTSKAAVDALKKQLELAASGQYGKVYSQMHPAQKAVMPEAVYITCASKSNHGTAIDDIQVVSTHKEPVVIPGTSVTAPSTAITVKLALSRGLLKQSQTTTFHEFYVKGRWLYTASKVYGSTDDC